MGKLKEVYGPGVSTLDLLSHAQYPAVFKVREWIFVLANGMIPK